MESAVMLSPTEELTGQRRHYDITIDGVARGQVLLEHYFKPTTGIYGEEVAVWAGRDVAIGSLREGPFRQIALPEPLLAVYRLRAGWLVVAEISVYLLDEALTVVLRRIHNEVLMSSSWSDSQLLVRDFAGRVLRLDVDESALSAGDFLAS